MTTETRARVTLKGAALLAALDSCKALAAKKNDGRLTGIHVTMDAQSVTFDATDGHALVRIVTPSTIDGEPCSHLLATRDDYSTPMASFTLKAVIAALKPTVRDGSSVTVSFEPDGARLIIGASAFTLPYMHGYTFPNVSQLIPGTDGMTGSRTAMSASLLGDVLACAKKHTPDGIVRIHTKDENGPMRLDWTGSDFEATAVVMPMFVKWDS